MSLSFGIGVKVLGVPIAKLLLKRFLGETGEKLGSGLVEIAAAKIADEESQRKAARIFESIGDKIVKRIVPTKFNQRREERRRQIEAIAHRFNQNQYLVSTRPTAVPEHWLGGIGFIEANINPMSETDRGEFIRRWHQAVSAELAKQGRGEDVSWLAEELIAKLSENPAIGRLGTNPLLCAVLCALHRERNRKLPESQSELCEAICHLLLHRRELEAGLSISEFPREYRELTYEQKRAIVQEIAHHMVRNEEFTIQLEDAIGITKVVAQRLPNVRPADAPMILQTLVERSGLLREQRPGFIDFVHNTIKEFLAAELFAADIDVSALAKRAADDSWRQVVLFASATRDRQFATRLIKSIVEVAEGVVSERKKRQLLLAAVNCRYAALQLERDIVEVIARIERNLIPPRNMTDADVLAASGDSIVNLLKYKEFGARETAACVRTLRLIGTALARNTLKGYYHDMRHTVVVELVQAVNPLLLVYVQNLVKRGRAQDSTIAKEINDLSPLRTMADVNALDLSGVAATDASPLGGMTHLKRLNISHTRIASINVVGKMAQLRELSINVTGVKDLEPLRYLNDLARLEAAGSQIADLSPLSGLDKLEWVNVSHTQVVNFEPLVSCSALRFLNLSGCGRAGSAQNREGGVGMDWASVGHLTQLNELTAFGAGELDARDLESLRKLTILALDSTPIKNVASLGYLKELKKLSISYTGIDSLAGLQALDKLEFLDVGRCAISDFEAVREMKDLVSLDVANTALKGLEELGAHPALRTLDASGTAIENVEFLREFPLLERVRFLDCQIEDLEPLLNVPKLGEIGIDALSELAVDVLCQMPELKRIYVKQSNCSTRVYVERA